MILITKVSTKTKKNEPIYTVVWANKNQQVREVKRKTRHQLSDTYKGNDLGERER